MLRNPLQFLANISEFLQEKERLHPLLLTEIVASNGSSKNPESPSAFTIQPQGELAVPRTRDASLSQKADVFLCESHGLRSLKPA
jgi:hypothetical protein